MTPWYFNPIIVQIGPFPLRWYGLMYAVGFIMAWLWINYSGLGKKLKLSSPQKDTLLMVLILGVLVGGRLGYILFYNLSYYLTNPLEILAVWKGGMSFHGGLIGVALALTWISKKYKISGWSLADLASSIAPLGLMFGRLGNFINGELYGRIAGNDFISQKLCLYFPNDPQHCRYPTQLLESLLEGLVLFLLLWAVNKKLQSAKNEYPGLVASCFLIFYGALRFLIEFWREPDPQLGFIFGNFLTMGQLLSSLMIITGVIIFSIIFKKNRETNTI